MDHEKKRIRNKPPRQRRSDWFHAVVTKCREDKVVCDVQTTIRQPGKDITGFKRCRRHAVVQLTYSNKIGAKDPCVTYMCEKHYREAVARKYCEVEKDPLPPFEEIQ